MHLRRRGTRDLAWWELASGRAVSQIARAVGLGLAVGLLAGSLLDLVARLAAGSTFDQIAIAVVFAAGIWSALGAGIGGAVAVGLSVVGFAALRRPSRLVLRLDRSFLRRFLIGAGTRILVVLSLLLVIGLTLVAIAGWFANGRVIAGLLLIIAGWGLRFGLQVGNGFGLLFGLLRPSEQPPTPASSLGSNRLVSIITLLVVGLSFALLFARFSGVDLSQILASTVLALVVGLPIGLGLVAVLPWGGHQLARLWLALRGRLPWRLFAFLEDAHQRGVLRQVGGVYQFRHARLQDRLAGP